MFNHISKKALNKKELRILSEIISETPPTDEDIENIIKGAQGHIRQKIILKRPAKSATPKFPKGYAYYAITAPSVRLDVYNVISL